MKKAFQFAVRFLAIALVLSCPAWATWTVVQHKVSAACTTTSSSCNVTVTSTGTGNVIVIGMAVGSSTEQIVSVSGGGTYTHPATACHGVDSTTKGTDCAYTLASTSGATTITVTRTDATTFGWNVEATELSFTSGPVSVDTGSPQVRDQSSLTTTPAGVTLTLAGSNDAIYQIISGTGISAISSPYSTNQDFINFGGYATAINTVSGTAPTWTQSSSRAALSAIAFTETAAASTQSRLPILGVGQ